MGPRPLERLRDAGGCWPGEVAEALTARGSATAHSDEPELLDEAELPPADADEARRLPASWGRLMEHSGAHVAGAGDMAGGGGLEEDGEHAGGATGGERAACAARAGGGGGEGGAGGGCRGGTAMALEGAGGVWGAGGGGAMVGASLGRHARGEGGGGGAGTSLDRRMRGMMIWTGMGGKPAMVTLAGGGVEDVFSTITRMVSMHVPAMHSSLAARVTTWPGGKMGQSCMSFLCASAEGIRLGWQLVRTAS